MKKSIDLSDPSLYLNRELSQIAFNQRVLALAKDRALPLLERLRYVFICSSNLDEFFEIRVAGVKEKIALRSTKLSPDGLTPDQVFAEISDQAHSLISEIYALLNNVLFPALAKKNINFLPQTKWSTEITEWVKNYFIHEILPVLSPIGLDLAHPFPRLVNKSLNFMVSLKGKDAFGRDSGMAILHAPRALPRVIKVPKQFSKKGDDFIFLTEIIQAHAQDLFPGMQVTGCYQFRLTRNSDLFVEEEEIEDLALALKTELFSRHYGNVVRLEIAEDCPSKIVAFLLKQHQLTESDRYFCAGPVNLSRYMAVLDMIDRPNLCFDGFKPSLPVRLQDRHDLFAAIRQHDILLHHPFQSFRTVIDFIRQATLDPNVIAIKQTLYRTHPKSMMVKALIEAARAGKEVTAVIELRARFDEESNLRLANHLQEAGALVVYGVLGLKTHAKMTLVVRREQKKLRSYVHLGTGNYHERTAKQYTDFGLLTYNQSMTNDVQQVFQMLTGMGQAKRLKKVLHSPFTFFSTLQELILFETEQAKKNKKAHIIIKVNGLSDTATIKLLYQASQAGVKIDLLVRGICCLRPGVPGVSDNIKVRSIVGRFLEHSRVYYFYHAGDKQLYCASADLMERNLYNRVELAYPITDPYLIKRVKKEGLKYYLLDNQDSWLLDNKGKYIKCKSKSKTTNNISAQLALLLELAKPNSIKR